MSKRSRDAEDRYLIPGVHFRFYLAVTNSKYLLGVSVEEDE